MSPIFLQRDVCSELIGKGLETIQSGYFLLAVWRSPEIDIKRYVLVKQQA